jgi:thiol-disulfide isomerase/thioredoxin
VKRRDHLLQLAGIGAGALGTITAAAGLLAPRPAAAAPARPGEPVPWPEVRLLDGSRFGPAQAADHAMVVVFWSTSCPFCRRHNPRVEKLHQAAAGRRLRVLGVARERDATEVQRHARTMGYSFPITLDAQPLAEVLSLRRLIPLTVTVDRQGRLRQVIPGEMAEGDVLELLQLAS